MFALSYIVNDCLLTKVAGRLHCLHCENWPTSVVYDCSNNCGSAQDLSWW